MRRLVRDPTIQYIIIDRLIKYDYFSLHGFTAIFMKNFIIQNMERKKIGQIQKRISMRRLIRDPTKQYIITDLLTKYVYSSLYSFTAVFYGKNSLFKIWKGRKSDKYRNKQEKVGLQSHDIIHHYQPQLHTKYDYSSLHGFTEIFDEKLHYSKCGKEEYRTNTGKKKNEKAGLPSHDTIHNYQPAYQI